MKNKVLYAVIGGVFAVCAAVLGYAAWKIYRRPKAGGAVAGRVSRDAVVVATLDLRQVRAWQPASSLHDTLRRPSENASETLRDVSRRYAELVRNCGFEPWQKVDAVALGVERSVVAATDQSAVAAFVDGTYTAAEAERCLRWLATQDRSTVTTTTVGRHAVHSVVRQGEQPGPRATQFTPLPGTTLVTQGQYTQRALAVVDGDAPALASDAPIARMMTRLGATTFLGAAADLAELRARQARTVDQAVDQLVQQHPTAPDLALLRQARVGGLSMAVVNNGLAVTLRAEEPTAANAEALSRALTTVIQQHRGEVQEAIRNARQSQQIMRFTVGTVPGMTERFERMDEGFTALEQVTNQVAARAEASDAIVAMTVTQPQITALQNAFRAFGEIMAEASRNPLGGILGGGGMGRGGGLQLGVPGLTPPAPEQPVFPAPAP